MAIYGVQFKAPNNKVKTIRINTRTKRSACKTLTPLLNEGISKGKKKFRVI